MSRLLILVCGLVLGAATASAQEPPETEAPLAPDETEETAQPTEAPPAEETLPPAAPPPAAPPPAEAAPPPEPAPRQRARYEGEVSQDYAAAPAYETDPNEDDDADDSGGGGEIPGFSIRIDPLNWLLEGRLGLELEVVAWKFISVELVPVFVTNTEPPSFNFSGREDPISQHSNGLGPISGASLGAGFWLSGQPLHGYVLRAYFTNYGYTYEASDSAGTFDKVSFTERRFVFFFGSHNRFGVFTLAGGIGLGYELNQQQRCFVNRGAASMASATSGCPDEDEQHILLDRSGSEIADVNGGLHPMYLLARISLGVSFD